MLKRVVISAVVTVGVGAAGCGSTVVKTVTVTGPTTTVQASAPAVSTTPTHTITRTVYKTSPNCIALARSGSRLASIDLKLFKAIAPLPELVKEAAAAGLGQDVEKIKSIGAETQAINGHIEAAAQEVHELDESLPSGGCS